MLIFTSCKNAHESQKHNRGLVDSIRHISHHFKIKGHLLLSVVEHRSFRLIPLDASIPSPVAGEQHVRTLTLMHTHTQTLHL